MKTNVTRLIMAALLLTGAVVSFATAKVQIASVRITEQGFEPASLKLRKGVKAKVTFERTTDATCAKEVVISEFGIKQTLPLNQSVTVEFTPTKKGEFVFTCGMNMMRGQLVVK